MEMEITPSEHVDHPKCLRCHRSLKDPKWRKLGFGKKCYAKHCQECQQRLGVAGPENQERAPYPKIQKADKRAALEKAHAEEMARIDPAPTEAQKRAAEQRLVRDVDKALGLEEEEDGGESDPAESADQVGKKKKVGKVPKGQALVRPGAFNRSSRSMIVSA